MPVVEYSRPGAVQDDRTDHGFHEGGLWAQDGTGANENAALLDAWAQLGYTRSIEEIADDAADQRSG